MALQNDGLTTNFDFELVENGTLEDGIKKVVFQAGVARFKENKENLAEDLANELQVRNAVLPKIVQLLLYIVSQDSDMQPTGRIQDQKYHSNVKIKDKYREIRKWDVSYRIVERIKNAECKEVNKTDKNNENVEKISSFTERKESEAGKTMRPHFRRGHWHTYWLGKRTAKDRKHEPSSGRGI